MGGYENRDVIRLDELEQMFPQLGTQHWVHADRRLVQYQQSTVRVSGIDPIQIFIAN